MGNGGLTQKEAVYKIVSEVLGSRLQAGVDTRKLLYGVNREHYGRRVHDSAELDAIRSRIAEDIRAGKIPCRKRAEWLDQQTKLVKTYAGIRKFNPFEEYANRIAHYWLKNDGRLNGRPKRARPFSEVRSKYDRLKNSDHELKTLNMISELTLSKENSELISLHLANRRLHLLLEAINFDLENFPEEFQSDFRPAGSRKVA